MLSMKEIAKRAGVSVATVSRVVNDSPLVTPESKKKVLKCIEESGYQMNFQARNLRRNKTNTIIAVVPSIRNPIFAEIFDGMSSKSRELNYNILISSIDQDLTNVTANLDLLDGKQADGIVFVSKTFNKEIISRVNGKHPFVVCNELYLEEDVPSVAIDNYKASCEATGYLLSKGCRNIGYISGHTTSTSSVSRTKGYKDTLENHGLRFSAEKVIYGTNSSISEYQKIAKFIEKNDFDGFLVNSDIKAALTIRYLIEERKMDFDKINLVSFDGSYISDMFVPSFTSIVQPLYEIGQVAIEKLVAQIDGGKFEMQSTIPYKLAVRNT